MGSHTSFHSSLKISKLLMLRGYIYNYHHTIHSQHIFCLLFLKTCTKHLYPIHNGYVPDDIFIFNSFFFPINYKRSQNIQNFPRASVFLFRLLSFMVINVLYIQDEPMFESHLTTKT